MSDLGVPRIEVSTEGRIEAVNEAAADLFCRPVEDLAGCSAQLVFDEVGIPLFPVALLRQGHPSKVTVPLSTRDGRCIPAQVSGGFAEDGDEMPERIIYTISGISAQGRRAGHGSPETV